MCRNKKRITAILVVAVVSLTGCSLPSSLITDTGSGKTQSIIKEDYLNTSALSGENGGNALDKYKIITLTKGTFTEEALQQSLERSYINVPTVNYMVENLKSEFGEYLVDYMEYVEKGDTIATVYTEVDEISIKQAQINLQRLEERYAEAKIDADEKIQKLETDRESIYSKTDYAVAGIEIKQAYLDWDMEKYNYERQIESAKEELDKLTEVGSVYNITAPASGYVFYSSQIIAGKEVKYGDYICHILDEDSIYLTTDGQADRLGFGMEFDFSSKAGNLTGKIINGGVWGLYGNLDKNEVIFRIDADSSITIGRGRVNYVMNGDIVTVSNVVIIPAKAVTVDANGYYVTVLRDDGSLVKTEFTPGGYSSSEFWVLEGVDEGTQVVYN